jgi:hypothetical protein
MPEITRRSFLIGATAVGALCHTKAYGSPGDLPDGAIVLENDHLKAEFDRKYGSLLTLENKQTGWRGKLSSLGNQLRFAAAPRGSEGVRKQKYLVR